ncbi:hypothetical protein K3888_11245 [Dietzia aurantiaca]|uniref:hypothetical protein n=1 Tax=Dietzia aurantiaca TaxID=983873 RepID=UPI001E64A4BA|nr:hypothetical protein [Dietzia aurantiaca]MCD2263273.1 hypothetical protein [Dietzia aurantiaca]
MPSRNPVLVALADTQRRLAAAVADAEQERLRRHRTEQLLASAQDMIADQHRLIEDLGGRPARPVAA